MAALLDHDSQGVDGVFHLQALGYVSHSESDPDATAIFLEEDLVP
ncbi:hypothetical protein M7I_4493 [Glarea lozoyensis 74030]|uniref:Uncharacterized protein n=1 Tax=Glarea lozoyensis (strain ATCC 74030 / MF5533) TaxID=1104152 RepID=H0EPB9_GLAL7|nr:hypothetical protein M7I_4493 [Glarea lozoyensis 74030]